MHGKTTFALQLIEYGSPTYTAGPLEVSMGSPKRLTVMCSFDDPWENGTDEGPASRSLSLFRAIYFLRALAVSHPETFANLQPTAGLEKKVTQLLMCHGPGTVCQ